MLSQHVNVTFPFTVEEIVSMGAGESPRTAARGLVRAALDEAARLVHEPGALEEMEADAAHNQRLVLCAGGLRRRLYQHATHALSLAASSSSTRGPDAARRW